MRVFFQHILFLLIMLAACLKGASAQQVGIHQTHDPWGRFQPGAWKIVREVTETFEDKAPRSSVTETMTCLKEVGKNDVALDVEVAVEVHGKRFEPTPRLIRQGFNGEPIDQDVRQINLRSQTVTIQGRPFPCRVIQLESDRSVGKVITKVFYSQTVEPYILRREIRKIGADGQVIGNALVEVTSLDVPYRFLGEGCRAADVRAVLNHPQGTTTTMATVSMDVPGGVVAQTLEEVDRSGRLVRRSSLEVVDYGLELEQKRHGLRRRYSKWPRNTNRGLPH